MTKPLRVEPQAEGEIRAAAIWYDQQRPGLGLRFVDAVEEAIERIEKYPEIGSLVAGVEPELDARHVMVREFPYLVIYLDLPTEISVIAVANRDWTRVIRRRTEPNALLRGGNGSAG